MRNHVLEPSFHSPTRPNQDGVIVDRARGRDCGWTELLLHYLPFTVKCPHGLEGMVIAEGSGVDAICLGPVMSSAVITEWGTGSGVTLVTALRLTGHF